MADFSYDTFVEEADAPPLPRRVMRLTNGTGAAISVALILGLGVWGYQIAVRDARGVPVVMALEGPMRIAPEKPGGEQMAHQGLAVNNVAAEGEVAAPADRLELAPRQVELTDDDTAGFAPIPPSAVVPTLTSTIPIPGQFSDEGSSNAALEGDAAAIEAEPEATEAAVLPPVATVVVALPISALPISALPVSALASATASVPASVPVSLPMPADGGAADVLALPLTDAVDAALAEAVAAEPVLVNATAAAVATSIRPATRPAGRAVAAAAAETPGNAPEAGAAEGTAVTFVASGTRLIQLGAYDDVVAANLDWERLSGRYAAYFKGKSPVIQKATSGGRVFYRLRAVGFEDEDEARRLCAVLINDQMQCIPVLTR